MVDGVIGGEGEGPMVPSANRCGIIVAGSDLTAVDLVSTTLMGFDYRKIPQFAESLDVAARNNQRYPTSGVPKIDIASNVSGQECLLNNGSGRFLSFIPPRGWIGHIELENGISFDQLFPMRIGDKLD